MAICLPIIRASGIFTAQQQAGRLFKSLRVD
jgi:hypothetical protein